MGMMLIISIIYFILSIAATIRRDISIIISRNLILILVSSLIISIFSINIISFNKGIGLFGGLFYVSSINNSFAAFLIFISFLIILLNSFYPRKFFNLFIPVNKVKFINKGGEEFNIMEYPLIILFIIIGGIFLISSNDIVSIFLSIELQSYGLYLLCALYRNSEKSTSASLIYFLLGGFSSCFILFGTALLYANSGTSNLEGFYIITNISDFKFDINNLMFWYNSNYMNFALLFLAVGFLFKISAAPFHFWSPDVYDAIPTVVTTFVAIMAKISILIFLLELVYYTSYYYIFNFNWTNGLVISSLLSLIIGTVLGLNQSRIKRLYAYSTISHLGFLLLALSINSVESIQSFLFYLMQYSLSNLNAFIILISIGYSLYLYTFNNKNLSYEIRDKNNSPIQLIKQIKGYFYLNSFISMSLAITIFSFIGIPPLVGFFGKQMVLSAALDKGYIFITFVAIVTSVISAVYYLTVIKHVFFEETDYEIEYSSIKNPFYKHKSKISHLITKDNLALSNHLTISISVLTLIIVLFILNPQEWLSIANILAVLLYT